MKIKHLDISAKTISWWIAQRLQRSWWQRGWWRWKPHWTRKCLLPPCRKGHGLRCKVPSVGSKWERQQHFPFRQGWHQTCCRWNSYMQHCLSICLHLFLYVLLLLLVDDSNMSLRLSTLRVSNPSYTHKYNKSYLVSHKL